MTVTYTRDGEIHWLARDRECRAEVRNNPALSTVPRVEFDELTFMVTRTDGGDKCHGVEHGTEVIPVVVGIGRSSVEALLHLSNDRRFELSRTDTGETVGHTCRR